MTSEVAAWLLGQGGVGALVLARASGMAWAAPAWGTPGLSWRYRLAFCAVLTAAVLPAVGPDLVAPVGAAGLGRACLAEALVGAALGWSAALVVAGARQAGEVVGM